MKYPFDSYETAESFIERIVATDEFQKMQQIVKWIDDNSGKLLFKDMSSDYSMGATLLNTKGLDLVAIKDEIRKRYGVDEMRNAIHSSDSVKNMKRESKLYFRN